MLPDFETRDSECLPEGHVTLDVFQSQLTKVCGAFSVTPKSRQVHVNGFVRQIATSGFDVVEVAQDTESIDRATREIRKDPGGHFFLIIQKSGISTMEQDGHVNRLEPLDMMVVDSTKPSTFRYSGQPSHQISLHLPRDEQIRRFGSRICGGIHLRYRDPLARAMQTILTSIKSETGQGQLNATEAFYSVFGAFLLNRSLGETAIFDPHSSLRQRAVKMMNAHFADPDFAVSDLPRLLNVSVRHLQRAFQDSGATLREHLLELRLTAAVQVMKSSTAASCRSLAQIAFASGFSDLSTFHRQFKARYDVAPGTQLKAWREMQ